MDIERYEIQQNIDNNRFWDKSARKWREYMLISGYITEQKAQKTFHEILSHVAHPIDFRLIRRDKTDMIHIVSDDSITCNIKGEKKWILT